ncbi:Ku protein (plasmid) [Streptomyces scopuliridis]|uniref:non-homologous end joining protein Ku n=1 Tax=Streptomyces scopuliridis TaxID=452529 RepID=UPI002DDB1E7E|nr:Ku protein [Streptomyces scopuliridis]WSB39046.1 Ku protein [Streptomyces scopuliridis]
MPSSIWRGAISFGLVTIPIRVVTATQSHSISFRQVHLKDMGRIRYRKICELDGQELPDDEIGKGYELSKDQLIEVTDDDLYDLPLPTAKAIEIAAFVDSSEIDPIRLGDFYYLAVDGAVASKPYTLLREALKRSSKVAVAKFALRGRERLGLLTIRDDALILHSMHWPDEIRSPESLAPKSIDVGDAEITRAEQLIASMEIDDISGFRDKYRDALEKVIEAKSEGAEPPAVETPEPTEGRVVDLMAALEQSVSAARESRGEDATVHEMPKKKTAKKAKKTAAKKTSGRKPRSA